LRDNLCPVGDALLQLFRNIPVDQKYQFKERVVIAEPVVACAIVLPASELISSLSAAKNPNIPAIH
jgi:hypothetical protein